MNCQVHEPTTTKGPPLGFDEIGEVVLLTPRGVLPGPPVDGQQTGLFDNVRRATTHTIQWQPASRLEPQQSASPRVLRSKPLPARFLPPNLESNRIFANRARPSTLLLPTATSDWSDWQWFHRLIGLSVLGWAFVVVAVGWELFALAFSQCAGWGWDKGAFFFAWGLGILTFGFYLRTSTQQPVVSRLFLGMNILVVSVCSLVVATK
jgi:hypothetical protein